MDRSGITDGALFIGREHEIQIIERSLAAAQTGTSQALVLSGEAGIGKSRLVKEGDARASQAGFARAHGACYEQDGAFPYGPWIEALRSLQISGSAVQTKPLPSERERDRSWLFSVMRGAHRAPSADSAQESEADRRRLFESVEQFLTIVAREQPLLLIFEDLHWSDASSLDLLRFIVRRLTDQKILLLLTCRSDELTSPLRQLLIELERHPQSQHLALAPFTQVETAALVQARLKAQLPVPVDFLMFIVSLTDGNPFFIEEVLRSLAAGNRPIFSNGHWDQPMAARPGVPLSVKEAVWQRSESLSAGARDILRLAAVAGRHVDFVLIQDLAGIDETALLQAMRELIGAQLLVETSADELIFRHALTREAVYGAMLVRERRTLHRRVLAALEQRYSRSPDLHIADLAYHASEGEDWSKALLFCRRAGEQAQALNASREALIHYSRAIHAARQLALDPPSALLSKRGQIHELLGDFEAGRADYEEALVRARAEGDVDAEWQILLDLGFLWTARDYNESGRYLQQALASAQRTGSRPGLAHTLDRLGNWHFNQMRMTEALAAYRESLAIFRQIDDRLGIAETLDLLGSASFVQGDLIAGVSYLKEAVACFRDFGDKRRLAQCLVMIPLAYRFNTEIMGPLSAAELRAAGEEGRRLAHEIGWRAGEVQAYSRETQNAREAGDYGSALANAEDTFKVAEEIGHVGYLAAAHWGMGDVHLDLFDFATAGPHVEQAYVLARDSGSAIWQHQSRMARVRLHLLRGQLAQADLALGPSASPLPAERLTSQERETWTMRTELLLARQDAAAALAILDRLIAGTINIDIYGRHAIPRVSLLRGRALNALGHPGEAEAELRAAQEVAREQGKRPLLWRIALHLGRAAQMQGRRQDARAAFAEAAATIEEIAAGIPDEELRRGFVQGAGAGLPPPRPLTVRQVAKRQYNGLSAREREVAALIATGKSNRQIAETLVIAERTVDRHVANIMTKLGYNSRAQIAAWSVEIGLPVP